MWAWSLSHQSVDGLTIRIQKRVMSSSTAYLIHLDTSWYTKNQCGLGLAAILPPKIYCLECTRVLSWSSDSLGIDTFPVIYFVRLCAAWSTCCKSPGRNPAEPPAQKAWYVGTNSRHRTLSGAFTLAVSTTFGFRVRRLRRVTDMGGQTHISTNAIATYCDIPTNSWHPWQKMMSRTKINPESLIASKEETMYVLPILIQISKVRTIFRFDIFSFCIRTGAPSGLSDAFLIQDGKNTGALWHRMERDNIAGAY